MSLTSANVKFPTRGKIAKLPREQQEHIHEWLFGDRLSYPETERLIEAEFGAQISQDCLARYYTKHWARCVLANENLFLQLDPELIRRIRIHQKLGSLRATDETPLV